MRKDVMAVLRCPACGAKDLILHVTRETEQEVRAGTLTCSMCSSSYPIRNGVAELLSALDAETLRERQARDLKKRDWSVERQRPFVNDMLQTPWVWPSFEANVQQGLGQLQPSDALVLDIGAATCWSTRMLSERGARAVAIDVSTGMLEDGEAQFSVGVYFDRIAATMNNLPFNDRVFDNVFTSATIHHSSNLQRTFSEIGRVLKPGGAAILVNEPVLGLLRHPSQFGRHDIEQGMNEHIYRLQDYVSAARDTGLRTTVLFPESLRQQMSGYTPMPRTLPLRMMKSVWRWLPDWLREGCLLPGHWLIGLDLVAVAHK